MSLALEVFLLSVAILAQVQISFKGYVIRMKEGQNHLYCISDESIVAASPSLFLESLHKRGLEVLYMVDPFDEYDVQQLKEFDATC